MCHFIYAKLFLNMIIKGKTLMSLSNIFPGRGGCDTGQSNMYDCKNYKFCLVLYFANFVLLMLYSLENYSQFLFLLLLGGLEHPVSQENSELSMYVLGDWVMISLCWGNKEIKWMG